IWTVRSSRGGNCVRLRDDMDAPVAFCAPGPARYRELLLASASALGLVSCYWITPYEDLTAGEDPSPSKRAACPPTASVCDDFESGKVDKWSGQVMCCGGTVGVDTVETYRGKSLHAHAPPVVGGAQSGAYVSWYAGTAISTTSAGRAYV